MNGKPQRAYESSAIRGAASEVKREHHAIRDALTNYRVIRKESTPTQSTGRTQKAPQPPAKREKQD